MDHSFQLHRNMRYLVALLVFVLCFGAWQPALAAPTQGTLTINNRSGEQLIIDLNGPENRTLVLAPVSQITLTLKRGKYEAAYEHCLNRVDQKFELKQQYTLKVAPCRKVQLWITHSLDMPVSVSVTGPAYLSGVLPAINTVRKRAIHEQVPVGIYTIRFSAVCPTGQMIRIDQTIQISKKYSVLFKTVYSPVITLRLTENSTVWASCVKARRSGS